MNRIKIIHVIFLCLIGTGVFSCNSKKDDLTHIPEETRTKYNFNLDWKFIKQNPENAQNLGFKDDSWETISCPHTFNDIDTFDDLSHGHHDGEDNHWRGTVWYRKHFKLPQEDSGKKVFIEFESVRQIADVYINGKHIGQNQTGFIPFGFDLTPYLKFGEDNVLAVKVNNDRGDHFRDNFPLVWHHEHWHPNHGGIYRNVFLHVMEPLHITLPLYDNLETTGTYVYAENITAENADVTINAEVQNEYPEAKNVVYEAKIVDNDGKVVSTTSSEKSIEAGEKYTFSATTSVSNPNRWYTRHPYMYNVETVLKVDGKAVDSYKTPLGIRSFDFNKDSGFHNNGEYAKLHGWGQKPTNSWAGLGAALPDWLRDYTYQLMDEAGGNFIRWGHCAGSPAEIAMGDKYGFVTLMPGVSGESQDEGETWDIRIKAFKDMIVYYRNHPSIFIWEGGNWAETEAHYQEILDIINTFDPNGKRLMGNRRADVKNDSEGYVSIEIGTEGWEREYPDLPVVESEYNREEAPRRIWDKQSPDDNFYSHPNLDKNTYKLNSEQFAVKQAYHWWNKMGKKAFHVGGANWVFSDGPHGGRCPTEVTRASGEVDAVRLPKEAFYALKAMWRPEPQLHIIGHWNYEVGIKKDIFVISNTAGVKLYVNGKVIGENITPKDGYVYQFKNVAWEAGEIKAEGFINNELKVSQIKETSGKPVALKLTPITGPKGWQADGSDVALIDVEVVDANGKRCPLAKGRVDFTIEGPGIWRGGYNSGKPNSTNNLYLDIEAGINRVAVKSLLESGTVKITAIQSGLKSDHIELTSNPVDLENGLITQLPQVYENVLTEEPIPAHTPEIPEYVPGIKNRSELFKKFSYTGDGKAMLRTNMHWGKKAYTDLEHNYTHLPKYVNGAEYVRIPNSDNRYWARDQLQFIAGVKMHIYVLHDDTVPRPEFLLRDYKDNGDNIKVGDITMSVFHRVAEAGESIIMAGNSDGDAPSDCRMYTVIGKKY
ncbi:glycoside hydrolase family 2 protein [Algibacter sp. R77976]|uniref:glycoside hydrolase family 2 protein n=1 Tax=Algibacter sp. R77976 TaxID=3093873 RepID=UPI0037C6C0C1